MASRTGAARRAPDDASFEARAVRLETGTTGLFEAKARDLTVVTPILIPVNDPGPAATAKDSTSRMARPWDLSRRSTDRRSRAECVAADCRLTSPSRVRPRKSATEPLAAVAGSLIPGP